MSGWGGGQSGQGGQSSLEAHHLRWRLQLSPLPSPSQHSVAAPARRLRTCTQHMPMMISGRGAQSSEGQAGRRRGDWLMLNGVRFVKSQASVSHSITHSHRGPGNWLTARGIDGNR